MLSALLPGVRELRAPLITGALWCACIWLIGGSRLAGNETTLRFVKQFHLDMLPTVIWLGAAALLVYLVGSFLVLRSSPVSRISRRLRPFWYEKVERLGNDRKPTRLLHKIVWRLWRMEKLRRPLLRLRNLAHEPSQDESVDSWLRNEFQRLREDGRVPVMRSVYRGCGGPNGFEAFYHPDSVTEYANKNGSDDINIMLSDMFVSEIKQERPAIEARIQMRFPEVYSEIDRLKVESELRWSIFWPLIFLSVILAWIWSPISILLILISVLSLRDGNRRMRQATEKTWSVFTAGDVSSPILDAMSIATDQENRDFGSRQESLDRRLGTG